MWNFSTYVSENNCLNFDSTISFLEKTKNFYGDAFIPGKKHWKIGLKLGPFLEIGITKKWCFSKFYLTFKFLTDKKVALYNFFAQKNKGSMTIFLNLLLRPCLLSFLKIWLNQWWNWKLHLVFASHSKSLTMWLHLKYTFFSSFNFSGKSIPLW